MDFRALLDAGFARIIAPAKGSRRLPWQIEFRDESFWRRRRLRAQRRWCWRSQKCEAAGAMQTRILGKTGARVSIVALGCGSRLLAYGNEDAAVNVLNHALDAGISYFDTAYGYGDGQSETWVGQVAKTRRKEFFLATKVEPRDGDAAMRILEGSLKRLADRPDRFDSRAWLAGRG